MLKGVNCNRLDGDMSYMETISDGVWRLGGTHAQEEGYAMTRAQMKQVLTDKFIYTVNRNDSNWSQAWTVMSLRYMGVRTPWLEMFNEDYFDDFDSGQPQNQQYILGRESAERYILDAEEKIQWIRMMGGTMNKRIILVGAYIKRKHNTKRRQYNQGWNDVVSAHCRANGYGISYHIYEADLRPEKREDFGYLDILVDQDLDLFITESGCIPVGGPTPDGVPPEKFYEATEFVWNEINKRLRPTDVHLCHVSHQDKQPLGLFHKGRPTELYSIYKQLP